MKYKRIGLLGGTFDPIHLGHMMLAGDVKDKLNLDCVLFIPSNVPPHREQPVASPYDRFEMTKLATEKDKDFSTSNIEYKRHGRSYAVDTIMNLREKYEGARLFYIIGVDAAEKFLTWREPEKIVNNCNLVIASRPGYKLDHVYKLLETTMLRNYREKIHFLSVKTLDISSTDVRRGIKEARDMKDVLDRDVYQYINKNNLYKN